MSSIITIVSLSYAPQFSNISQTFDLIRRIYCSLILGIAITTAISLLINPTSCRQIVFRDFTKYLSQLRKVLDSERKYLAGLETRNPFKKHADVQTLMSDVKALRAVHGALFAHMGAAKKEIAWGRLSPADIKEIQRLLRRVFLPVVGVSSIIDVFERLSKVHGWETAENDPETASETELSHQYQEIMRNLHDHIQELHNALGEGIDYVLVRLKLSSPPDASEKTHQKSDVEANPGKPKEDDFAALLKRKVENFDVARLDVLRLWCERHKIQLAPDSFESNFDWITKDGESLFGTPLQRQLFVLLYVCDSKAPPERITPLSRSQG
jgi:hypothetical protein